MSANITPNMRKLLQYLGQNAGPHYAPDVLRACGFKPSSTILRTAESVGLVYWIGPVEGFRITDDGIHAI